MKNSNNNNEKIDLKYLLQLLFQDKKTLLIGQIVTIIAVLISIPIPLMLPALVDEVLLQKPSFFVHSIDQIFGSGSAFYYIALVTFSVIFLRIIYFVFTSLMAKIFTKIAKFVTYKIRQKLLLHLQNVSMNKYETLGSGAIAANLITDVETLDKFIITSASKFISSVITLLAIAIVMIFIHPVLGIMIMIIQPLTIFISKKISSKTKVLKQKENQSIESFQNNLSEVLELFGQIKASNKEKSFFQTSIENANNIQQTSNEYNYKSVMYEKFSYTVFLIGFELIRAAGLLMVIYSDLSIGMMFAMFGYIWFIMTPIQDILTMQYSWAGTKAALHRINKILELETEPQGTITLESSHNLQIKLENLSFSYNSDKPILIDISMCIEPKSKIALIGASGSGKTTLAQIISGFYTKTSGELCYNDHPIESLKRDSIRKEVFLVLQMPMLFNNTLRFNLTMGEDCFSHAQIKEALQIAQLEELLLSMPKGLDTIVGKNGVRLSGGQRQRLSIARMVLANPSVVIFDESTSALDVHTESKLFFALQDFLKNKTVITIAHRLSTVKNADKIFVLQDGKIVQSGTHEELEDQEGHYNQFVKSQLQ
ncbi:MAG: ABC transporter ATP-binding protein [Campylobacterales bacterium]|nr:ABC transporter ATP-binding protein [Campylobacterales bacterium]